ncbi:hypothetical protein ACB094_11G167500 [Castanea mollissima]
MGDDCCEPLPQSVGAKKGLMLGLRLSLSKPRRSQSKSLNHCHSPKESTLNHLKSVGLLADGFGSTPEMHRRDLIWVAYRLQVEVDRRSSWQLNP